MAQDAKLDMSLDQLIEHSRKKSVKPKAAGKPAGKLAPRPSSGKPAPKGKLAPQGNKRPQANVKVVPRPGGARAPLNLKPKGGVQKGNLRPPPRSSLPAAKFVQRGGPPPRRGPAPAPTYMPRMRDVQVMPRFPNMGMGMGNMGVGMNPMAMANMGMQQMGGMGMARGNMGMGQQGNMMGHGPNMGAQAQAGGKWQHDLFDEAQPEAVQSSSSKLFISNLDYKVTDDDVKELFTVCGDLKEHGIHYDKSGRSLGTAHVIFTNHANAMKAFQKYNNVALDGKKMSIELVESAVPPGTFKTLTSGINVSRSNANRAGGRGGGAAAAGPVRGRGVPVAAGGAADYMQE